MMLNKNDSFSIWLIGPSAAGKTTISKLLYNKIKSNKNLVLIDGDHVRNLYENNLGYDKVSRSKNTYRYINLINWLLGFKISSIAAVISPFEKDRLVCREKIKNYLKNLEAALKELCPEVTLRVNKGGKGRAYAFEITYVGVLIYSKI